MSRIVYVNGEYLPEEDAKISVFDRGFLFADGVYEVSSVLDGKLVDNAAHLVRLARSLAELRMAKPAAAARDRGRAERDDRAQQPCRRRAVSASLARGGGSRLLDSPRKPSLRW